MSQTHITTVKNILRDKATEKAARKAIDKAQKKKGPLSDLEIMSFAVNYNGGNEARIIVRGSTEPMVVSV